VASGPKEVLTQINFDIIYISIMMNLEFNSWVDFI
jgi:hypothetical protein